jgi:hypothetical protein
VGNGDMTKHTQDYYWEHFWRFLSVVAVPFCGFLMMQVMTIKGAISEMDKRVAVIEANRFSAEDGMAVWKALATKANTSEVPPEWFVKEFNRLRDDFGDHKVRTRDEELSNRNP